MLIDTQTRVIGIIGNPLKQTLSPWMHNLTLRKLGLNYVYLPFEVSRESLSQVIAAVRTLNIKGLNVTIPFKEAVIPLLDDLSAEARASGAVNVICNDQGRLIGYNTDGRGFVASLAEKEIALRGRVLFIGAGGATRSVAYELACAGVTHIDFLDLDEKKAIEMASFIGSPDCSAAGHRMTSDNFTNLGHRADIIINASPVGMFPHTEQAPVASLDCVRDDTVICDLIYNPLNTRFLLMGQSRGLKTVSGVSMFVYQGAYTLEILTGVKPPVDFMKEVVLHKLKA
ncbi:MAG: shikimate dehydrogenase [Syntrophomonadaceae bacterium]|jgi:shikimate dehydrogenase